MNLEVIEKFLKESKVFYIATMDDNQPRVRPFGIIEIINNKLYIQTGLKKDVAKQILNNPRVEICSMNNGDWIRLSGELVLDKDIKVEEEMLDRHKELSGMYKAGDGNTALFYFKNGKALISSFTKENVIIEF